MLVNISAQVKTELFKDKAIVEATPSKLPIVAELELFEGLPELQGKISEFLFDVNCSSVKEAYQHYLERMKDSSVINPNDPKEVVTGKVFELHKVFGKDGAFVCFEATAIETQSYAGHSSRKEKSVCLMYDIPHGKVLTLDDIFTPSTAKYIKGKLNDSNVTILFIDCGETGKANSTITETLKARRAYSKNTCPSLHYGSRYQLLHMEIEGNRKYFSPAFNEIVDIVLK